MAAVVAAFAGTCVSVQAIPIGTLTVSDNAGDAWSSTTAADGVVTFDGSLGNWSINVTTGIENGSPTIPYLDLNSVDAYFSGGAGNVLTINFTYASLGPVTGGFVDTIGGTENGTSDQFQVFVNGNLVDSASENTAGFTSTLAGSAAGATSIGVSAVLIADTSGFTTATSFDDQLAVPDGGTTVDLLGLGLAGCAFLNRKMKLA